MDFKREYTYTWVVLAMLALIGILAASPVLVDMALVLGLVTEGAALFRKKKGDTLSEHLAFYTTDQPFRVGIVFACGFLIASSFVAFGGGGFPLTRVVLAVAFLGWFVFHILRFPVAR